MLTTFYRHRVQILQGTAPGFSGERNQTGLVSITCHIAWRCWKAKGTACLFSLQNPYTATAHMELPSEKAGNARLLSKNH